MAILGHTEILGNLKVNRDADIKGKINVKGQIISSVPTGVPPFVISSTTEVENLRAATAKHADTASSATYAGSAVSADTLTATLVIGRGGTGISSYQKGDMLYASDNNVLTTLGTSTSDNGKVLKVVSGLPSWQTEYSYTHPNHTGDVTSTGDGATVIANNAVTTAKIKDEAVTTAKIADGAVTTDKIADEAVTTAKIADGAVTTDKIPNLNVTTVKLANNAVTTAKIKDEAVTTDKIADLNITTAKLANKAVTLDKMSDLAENSIIGNNTASPGTPKALTKSQVLDFLNVEDGANAYSHPTFSELSPTVDTNTSLSDVTFITGITRNLEGHVTAAKYKKLSAGNNISISSLANGDVRIHTDLPVGKLIVGNGTGTVNSRDIADSSSASNLTSTSQAIPTVRDIYHGLPYINNSHSYNSNTNIYAPTTGGTTGYLLKANGTTETPTWTSRITTSNLPTGTEGTVLAGNGSSDPSYKTLSTINNISLLNGGNIEISEGAHVETLITTLSPGNTVNLSQLTPYREIRAEMVPISISSTNTYSGAAQVFKPEELKRIATSSSVTWTSATSSEYNNGSPKLSVSGGPYHDQQDALMALSQQHPAANQPSSAVALVSTITSGNLYFKIRDIEYGYTGITFIGANNTSQFLGRLIAISSTQAKFEASNPSGATYILKIYGISGGSSGGGGSSTLAGLSDTNITSPDTAHFLRYDGESDTWNNVILSAGDIQTGTLSVARGGTGRSSLNAYRLLAGGTTTTGNVQSVSAGTSGQLLRSNGSSSLPSFTSIKTINGQSLLGSGDIDISTSVPVPLVLTQGAGSATIQAENTFNSTQGLAAFQGTSTSGNVYLSTFRNDIRAAVYAEQPTYDIGTKYAGYFNGDVGITGNLTVGTGSTNPKFRIESTSSGKLDIVSLDGTNDFSRVSIPWGKNGTIATMDDIGSGGGSGGESYSAHFYTETIAENIGTKQITVAQNTKFLEVTLHRSGIVRGRVFLGVEDFNVNMWMGWVDFTGIGAIMYHGGYTFEVSNPGDANYVSWTEHRWN